MSFTENDRKIQSESGKSFPEADEQNRQSFVQAISLALRAEFGGGPSAVKTAARLTRANERAVRNWFEAKNGPGGENLVSLIQHSDAVLRTILELSGRWEVRVAADLTSLRQQLVDMVMAIDKIPR